MKNKVASISAFIIFLFILSSGIFENIVKFVCWLITLNMTQSKISMVGEIFVKIATWVISYGLVGIVFNAIGWFNKDCMKFAYFVISTLISFALCYVVMLLETYLLYIAIVVGVLLLVVVTVSVITYCYNHKHIGKKIVAEEK